ncbi:MAG: DUF933 domain-containing protein [Candidatus Hydrothermales bacterium]
MEKIGLVGFPNAGKSTFFFIVTGKDVERNIYPFTTVGKNEGKAEIEDELLKKLADKNRSTEIRNFKINIYDIAGIIEGAHRGEGLGNEFLSYIREADLLIFILRGFKDERVSSYLNEISPEKEREILLLELSISDLDRIEKKLQEKNLDKKLKDKLTEAKEKILKGIEPEDIKNFPLLMAKKKIYVINSDDKNKDYKLNVREKYFVSPLKIFEELREFNEKERCEILKELKKEGFDTPSEILEYAFSYLDFIRFYTLKGEIASSFPLKRGSTAYEAAGKIHSDIQKGFIKVEVTKPFNFLETPSWRELKEKGLIEIHGPDYIVKDRDILEFKFSSTL